MPRCVSQSDDILRGDCWLGQISVGADFASLYVPENTPHRVVAFDGVSFQDQENDGT